MAHLLLLLQLLLLLLLLVALQLPTEPLRMLRAHVCVWAHVPERTRASVPTRALCKV